MTVLARAAAAAIRATCQISERLTVTAWADRHRMLPDTSTSPGPFRSSVVPYTRRPMDLAGEPETIKIVLCWGTQTTKSTVIENILAHRIVNRPSPMVMVQPKIEHAEGAAKERLVPMVLATEALRARVRLGKATDSTLRYKRFAGGFLFVASARSGAELASRSAPVLFLDEVDLMDDLPNEGNPIEIVRKRQGAADLGLEVMTSTPRDASTSRIWPELLLGSNERFHVPCPHCGERQPLVFGGPTSRTGLKWPSGKPHLAEYLCDHCAATIAERHKRAMLAEGDWVPTNPEAPPGHYSFHLNSLYSPFAKSSWGTLASEFVQSGSKPADLQVFVNTRLAETWKEETVGALNAEDLLTRLEDMEEGVVPHGVGVLTAGLDVQADRIEVSVWGWGEGLQSWLIAHEILVGDTDRDPAVAGSVWQQARAMLARRFRHVSGREVPISAALMDSGYATSKVYRFCKPLRSKRVFACKGLGGPVPLLGKPTLQTDERFLLYPVGVDNAKNEFLRSQLRENAHGPGYVHLPSWLSADQCAQLVSEKRVPKRGGGWEWVRRREGQATEMLDCRNYARAALEQLGAPIHAGLKGRAEKLSEPVTAADPPPEPDASRATPAPRGRGTWRIKPW